MPDTRGWPGRGGNCSQTVANGPENHGQSWTLAESTGRRNTLSTHVLGQWWITEETALNALLIRRSRVRVPPPSLWFFLREKPFLSIPQQVAVWRLVRPAVHQSL